MGSGVSDFLSSEVKAPSDTEAVITELVGAGESSDAAAREETEIVAPAEPVEEIQREILANLAGSSSRSESSGETGVVTTSVEPVDAKPDESSSVEESVVEG